jgi:ComF family protein
MVLRLSNSWKAFLNSCALSARDRWVQTCILCGASAMGHRLCRPCASHLPRLSSSVCKTCAVPVPAGDMCGACLTRAPRIDAVQAAFVYTFPVDALIQAYKYRGDLSLTRSFAEALAQVARESVDVIVPMPLADARLRERGFNQANELARHIGRLHGIPVAIDGCRKVRHTTPQAALPWSERSRNVRGAFVCDADVAGKRVAIVDDVMTTGATLNELAKNIKRAGAARVVGWVVARALKHGSDAADLPNATATSAGVDPRTPDARD